MTWPYAGSFAAVALAIAATGVPSQTVTDRCDPSLSLPPGFCATIFVDSLGPARHLTVSPRGTVYVILYRRYPSDKGAGGIVALRDTDHDGAADRQERFGIYGTAVRWHGQHLYASTADRIVRYSIPGDIPSPEGREETVVTGFPSDDNAEHWPRPFAFDPESNLYVAVGAPSNSCQEENRMKHSPGILPCEHLLQSGGIWRLKADRPDQHYFKDGIRIATGLRATLSLAWNARAATVQFVQNGRDDLHALWPERFTEAQNARLPAEEMLSAANGADFGWPYCYFDPEAGRHVLAPEYGGDGTRVAGCGSIKKPLAAFPAHWVPGDILFYSHSQFPPQFRDGAFVAFLGGWGRRPQPQEGYRVVFLRYEGGLPTGSWMPFADGFAGDQHPLKPTDATYRPSGLATTPDGSLLIVDSRKGRVWRVRYIGHE